MSDSTRLEFKYNLRYWFTSSLVKLYSSTFFVMVNHCQRSQSSLGAGHLIEKYLLENNVLLAGSSCNCPCFMNCEINHLCRKPPEKEWAVDVNVFCNHSPKCQGVLFDYLLIILISLYVNHNFLTNLNTRNFQSIGPLGRCFL